MAKAKMKQVIIPNFSSEAKEAAWWDAHRSEIESEIRHRVKQKRPLTLGNLLRGAKPSQPVTLRIPKEDLETARRLAAPKRLGLPDLHQDAAPGSSGEECGCIGGVSAEPSAILDADPKLQHIRKSQAQLSIRAQHDSKSFRSPRRRQSP